MKLSWECGTSILVLLKNRFVVSKRDEKNTTDHISKIGQKSMVVENERWFRPKQGAYFQSNLTSKDIF